jgi:hypothetical protein
MVSDECAAGEDPVLNLTQSTTVHLQCSGYVILRDGRLEPCGCVHHAMW